MKLLDRYILKSYLGPFLLTFTITLFILVMQFLWLYIDELVGKGLGMGVILEFMAWGSATLLPMTLPLATLLASIMTLGGLGEHYELTAIKSAGVSLWRVLTPLVFVAVAISISAFFVANDLIPVAYKKIYALRDDIGRTKEEIKIPTGIFYDGIDGYMLRVVRHDEETGLMHDIMVYDHTSGMGNTSLTVADSGSIRLTPDKSNIVFTLYNGRTYEDTNDIKTRDTVLDQSVISFEEQTMIVSLEDYAFERNDDDRFGDEIMAKNLKTLAHDNDSLLTEFKEVKPMNVRRFMYGNSLRYINQLDTTLVMYKSLTEGSGLDFGELKDTVFCKKTARDLELTQKAIQALSDYTFALDDYDRNTFRYVSPARKMQIEMFRKFTGALACLLFFFIGAPLGSIIRKGGLGTPVIISALIYIFYWVIDISGKKLAKDGAITPFSGAFASSGALLPLGILLTVLAIREASLNFDSIKVFFRNIFKSTDRLIVKFFNNFRKNKGIIKVVYMGTPEFAVAPLKALMDAGYEISAVVTVADKQSGRGLKVNESAVKKFAVENNLPVLQPVSLKDPEFLEALRKADADMFVVVAFRMLPKEVWSMPRLGTFNLHASLLPQYRGAAPINWAVINGEKQTGVTTFLIDEQIDTGSIIFSETCPIEDYDNAGTLHDKLMAQGAALTVKSADALKRGKVKPQPQETYSRLHTAPKITKDTCRIEWAKDGYSIINLVRGLSPYPAAFSTLVNGDNETTVKIFEAYLYMDDEPAEPGTIITDGKTYLGVASGKYTVRIVDLQVAGKKRMPVAEFLKGFRPAEGCKFA